MALAASTIQDTRLRFHHVCFEVDDLEAAAASLSESVGAGPFFAIEHVAFDELSIGGEAVSWDHSLALGYVGSLLTELHQTHRLEPTGLVDALCRRPVSHVGYVVDDLGHESACLSQKGSPQILYGRNGPVKFAYHQTLAAGLVELLEDSEFFSGFCAAIVSETARRDGTAPLRAAPWLA